MQIKFTEEEVKEIVAAHVGAKFVEYEADNVAVDQDGTYVATISDKRNPKLAVPVPNQKMTR